jgi:hypothetical protein
MPVDMVMAMSLSLLAFQHLAEVEEAKSKIGHFVKEQQAVDNQQADYHTK